MFGSKIRRLVNQKDVDGLLPIALDQSARDREAALKSAFELLGDPPRESPDAAVVAEACRRLVKDDDPNLRGLAIGGLCVTRDPDAVPAALSGLTDENGFVRSESLLAIGFLEAPGCVGPVAGLLHDEDPVVRGHAAATLARLGDGTVLSQLEARATIEDDRTALDLVRRAIDELSSEATG